MNFLIKFLRRVYYVFVCESLRRKRKIARDIFKDFKMVDIIEKQLLNFKRKF